MPPPVRVDSPPAPAPERFEETDAFGRAVAARVGAKLLPQVPVVVCQLLLAQHHHLLHDTGFGFLQGWVLLLETARHAALCKWLVAARWATFCLFLFVITTNRFVQLLAHVQS